MKQFITCKQLITIPIICIIYFFTGNLNAQIVHENATVFEEKILVPNAFSPNDDGINDLFKIFIKDDVLIERFIIINRYGEIVFETKDANESWNGRFKGILANEGSYSYLIAFYIPYEEGIQSKKGIITLIR